MIRDPCEGRLARAGQRGNDDDVFLDGHIERW